MLHVRILLNLAQYYHVPVKTQLTDAAPSDTLRSSQQRDGAA
jgi:hypothetical protein